MVLRRPVEDQRAGAPHRVRLELDGRAAVPLVRDQHRGGVDPGGATEPLRHRPQAPGHPLDLGAAGVPQPELQVGARAADRARGPDRAAQQQRGGRVPLAVRLQRLEGRVKVVADLVEADDRVRDHLGDGHRVSGDEREHGVAEGLELVHVEREAGRLRVAAPPAQVGCGRGQPPDGTDAGRRADAPLALGDDVDRLVEALQQLARDDAHHARVAVRIGDDDRRRVRVDQGRQAVEHLVLDLLAVAVALVEEGRELEPAALRGGGEELERQLGFAEAPRGVEPGREDEGDVARRRRAAEPCQGQGRAHARPRRVAQALEPELDQRTVLAQERRDVGDRADRREVGVLDRIGKPELAVDRPQQVVGDAGAGELRQTALRERRRGGVDDEAIGEPGTGGVVVADDHLEAGALQRFDLVEVGDPAVDGEQQVRGGGVLRDAVGMDAVAVADPVGDEGLDAPTERPQAQRQQRGAGDPVGVVVAVDPHPPAPLEGVHQAVGGPFEVGDRRGREGRVEVLGDVVAQAARPHDRGELRVDAQGGRQPGDGLDRRGCANTPLRVRAQSERLEVRLGRGAAVGACARRTSAPDAHR